MSTTRSSLPGALLLLAAVPGLLALMACGGDDEPAAGFVLRVVDAAGEPVTTAEVFVQQPEGAAPEAAGRWSPDEATLSLPAEPKDRSVIVQAPGYRTERVEGLGEDRTLVLRTGYLVRLSVADPQPDVPEPFRLVFGIRPAPADADALSDEERLKLVQLMALAAPLADGEPDLPQGAPGLTLVDTAADRGILLPVPARYAVHWGLFDPRAGAWFSLTESGRAVIRVEDDDRAQRFPIPVSAEALARARAGLARRIAEIDAAGEAAAEDE